MIREGDVVEGCWLVNDPFVLFQGAQRNEV